MNLNDVLSAGPKRVKRFRVGRGPGSGAGKTASRGQHGAYSRSGYPIKFGFQGGTMRFFRRLPRRGFNNFEFRTEWATLDCGRLEAAFAAGETVTLAAAIERELVRGDSLRLKVLSNGELKKALTLDAAVAVSAQARKKVEAAGGKVLAPPPKKQPPNFRALKAAEKVKKAAAAEAQAAAAAQEKDAKKPAKGAKSEGEAKAKPAGEGKPKAAGEAKPAKEAKQKPAGGDAAAKKK